MTGETRTSSSRRIFLGFLWLCFTLLVSGLNKRWCVFGDSYTVRNTNINVIQLNDKRTVAEKPVHFTSSQQRGNASFLELLENLTENIDNNQTVAITGSGNPFVDSLASHLAACRGVPFINVFGKNTHCSKVRNCRVHYSA